MYESSRIDEVREKEVVLVDKDFNQLTVPCDHVVTCRRKPNTAFLEELRKAGIPAVNVGDSVVPRNLHAAVDEGASLGLALDEHKFLNPNNAYIDEVELDIAGQIER